MAREKTGDCKDTRSTLDTEICLEKESKISESNYRAFTGAIRQLLSLTYLQLNPSYAPGPTGQPLNADERLREFDTLQSAWENYRKIAVDSAYNQFKGGTHAPVFAAVTDQLLVRTHMRELDSIYISALRL